MSLQVQACWLQGQEMKEMFRHLHVQALVAGDGERLTPTAMFGDVNSLNVSLWTLAYWKLTSDVPVFYFQIVIYLSAAIVFDYHGLCFISKL
jgi:hypothetical protein